MRFERYTRFYDGGEDGAALRAGGPGVSFSFDCAVREGERAKLFVTGETGLFYQWKDEPDYPAHYTSITDALDSVHAFRAQYCLDLGDRLPREYARRLYKKIAWPPALSYLQMNPVPEEWSFGVWSRARGLRYAEGGYLRLRVEIYRAREGVDRRGVRLPPDEVRGIDLPEGDFDWRMFRERLTIPSDTAHVGVWIEGARYSGEVYIERPFLTAASGENLLPDFTTSVHDKEHFEWSAQYLSRKEWPEFRVELNGQTVFEGEVFERCHRMSEWSVDLPARLLHKSNTLTVSLISAYHDPLPYAIHEMGLIIQPDAPVSLIGVVGCGVARGKAYALLRTRGENTRVAFTYPGGKLSGPAEAVFAESGLHGVAFDCREACEDARFVMEADGWREEGTVPRVVERAEDGVITGTGDMLYTAQERGPMEEFLCWYIGNGVGNLLTIRPAYRWSGSRALNPEAWRRFVRVLNELGLAWAHMIDGRELPGIAANPDGKLLAGKGFLGQQHHEWDGSQFYWGERRVGTLTGEQVEDMQQRAWQEDPEHVSSRFSPDNATYCGNALYTERDPAVPRDMRLAEEARIAYMARLRGTATRHTGPSVAFKYLLTQGLPGWALRPCTAPWSR